MTADLIADKFDEKSYFIQKGEEVLAQVLWHEVENTEPNVPEHGGFWFFSGTWGEEEAWAEIPKEDDDQAIGKAKSRVEDHLRGAPDE